MNKKNIVITDKKPQHWGMSTKITPVSSHLLHAEIEVENEITKLVYDETINRFQNKSIKGFAQQNIPVNYLEQNFNKEIKSKIGNYLLEFHVTDFLLKEIIRQNFTLSSYPRFSRFSFLENNNINFMFKISTSTKIDLKEWNLFSFKSPRRKNYKDLDKQVAFFLENEFINKKKVPSCVEVNDWVCFNAQLINKDQQLAFPEKKTLFWMNIKDEVIMSPLQQEFIHKTLHESFVTNNLNQNSQEIKEIICNYNFLITVESSIKGNTPSFDNFKNFFKLKNKSEVHNKLIEIFSYKNNQSQRKLIVEEVFRLLLNKHRFDIPKHLMIRRQEDLLRILKKKIDYQIYKTKKNFLSDLEKLAEMQLKEEILIDQIAYKENTKVSIDDASCYLNLYNNKRLKEFIYFKPMIENMQDGTIPINSYLLEQTIRREKMLNQIIYQLNS
jgi:FKBP-type peptidyl-prolyl cis-trans isomerase (trigger factor)